MATIQIPDALDASLDQLVRQTGGSKEAYVSEAVRNLLEDAQDLAIVTERLKNVGPRTSLEDLVKEFGLED